MRNLHLVLVFSLLALTMGASAAPQLQQGSIVNAASFAVDGASNASIAQGSLFSLFGVEVGPATPVNVNQFPLPTVLGGVSIRIAANGQSFDCPMIFAGASQVSAILPSNVPTGTATLVLTYNGQESNPITFPVVAHMAGLFSRSSTGAGQAVVQNYISPASQPVNAIDEAAQPGQIAILWATGLGASLNADDRGSPATGNLIPKEQVRVYVGGEQAQVEYAGRSGCCAGVDQVNFVVPASVEGCFVPVVVTLNDAASNFTTMAVKKGGTKCDGALGLDAGQIEGLLAKSSVRTGVVALTRTRVNTFGFNLVSENGAAAFTEVHGAGFLTAGAALGEGSLALNSCTVSSYRTELTESILRSPNPLIPFMMRGLDAGATVDLSGPGGQRQLPRSGGVTGQYAGNIGNPSNPLVPFLSPGSYTIGNGSGGSDVGAFSVSRNVPAFVDWTNRESFANVSRSQPLNIAWTPAPAQSGVVIVSGFSYSVPRKLASAFSCYADPAAGAFTVPAYVTGAMLVTDNGGNEIVPAGGISVGGASNPSTFSAPGLDLGVFSVIALDLKAVKFQ